MIVAAAVPLAVSLLLCVIGGRLGRLLPPASATRLLPLASVVTALATGWLLSVLAILLLGQLGEAARLGHWSAASLHAAMPAPWVVGLPPALLVLGLLSAAIRQSVRTGRSLWWAQGVCRALTSERGDVVILDDDEPDAYTVPGLRGRVVVSTAMWHALPREERRVLLAHERSHLTHRHHLWIVLAELGAAANPLLRPLVPATRLSAERWADEDAAVEVGDRPLCARAIARAALARQAGRASVRPLSEVAVLGADGSDVLVRTRALLAPPVCHRRPAVGALVAVVLLTATVGIWTAQLTETQVERAQTSYAVTAGTVPG